MNAVETLALSKLVKDGDIKTARPTVKVGSYPVELTVKVTGTLAVGADNDRRPTAAVPTLAALALAMKYAGITGPHAKVAITRAMAEAMANAATSGYESGASEAALLAAHPEIAEMIGAVKGALDTLPKLPCAGPVKFTGSVETLSGS